MSIQTITDVFTNLESINNLSIQLLKYNYTKALGSRYAAREIMIQDRDRFDLLFEISRLYTSGKKNIAQCYSGINDYDGTADSMTIYRMDNDNPLIATQYNDFFASICDPDLEEWPMTYDSAYILKGTLAINDSELNIILASIANPITTLKRKYSWDNNTLKSISEKVINLRNTFDLLVVDNNVYFLTMAAENLFHMERSYKQVCVQTVESLSEYEVFSDIEGFKNVATSKHNPRRFVSYDKRNFEHLLVKENRKIIADKFGIALTGPEEIFDTASEDNCNKIVKVLCNKGMLHPINNSPVEVNGTKPWT